MQAARPDPSFSTYTSREQGNPLEVNTSERPSMTDAVGRAKPDILPCQERATNQNQPDVSTLLAATHNQARALEEIQVAIQKGFSELQELLIRSLHAPVEPSE